MQVQKAAITFAPLSGVGPRTAHVSISFAHPVQHATAVLTGLTPAFSLHIDHNVGMLQIQVNVISVVGTDVNVAVTFALRDSSNNWFHHYDGTISFAVIGE